MLNTNLVSLFCVCVLDEIMLQESSPLCAADISPDLRKQFAFLSGESALLSIPQSFATKDPHEPIHTYWHTLHSLPSRCLLRFHVYLFIQASTRSSVWKKLYPTFRIVYNNIMSLTCLGCCLTCELTVKHPAVIIIYKCLLSLRQ